MYYMIKNYHEFPDVSWTSLPIR